MGDILYRELVRGIKNNNETINNYTLLCGNFYYNKKRNCQRMAKSRWCKVVYNVAEKGTGK